MGQKNTKDRMTQPEFGSGNVFQEPLCLLDSDRETGKFNIHFNVLEQIEKIDQQLNTIAIAGPYRSGKSYLMCRLAGSNKGKIKLFRNRIE